VTVYLDSSVVLRLVLREPRTLKEWSRFERTVSSAILRVECFRALDRLPLEGKYFEGEIATRFGALLKLIEPVDFLDVTPAVLDRAAQPLRLILKTLDAIHLATALLWRESQREEFAFATHDRMLGAAAQSYGVSVLGL